VATLRAINLGIRFLLELAALACAAYWGWTLSTGTGLRVAAAIGLPFLVAGAWGLFISPKARFPTGRLGRASLGLFVFLAAALALFDRGQVQLALGFACVAIISSLVVYALPQ
jgi:uncharacterized protein DUF2568